MRPLVLLLALFLLSGCHSGWFGGSHPATKAAATKRPGATSMRAQKWMQTSIDLDLDREKRGEHPPSGKKTWREYWDWRISIWHKDKQSKQFEPYLARKRKELGLPEVKRL